MTSLTVEKPTALSRTCVIGLGSEFGDDRVGWCVIDGLRKLSACQNDVPVKFVRAATPADLVGSIEGNLQLIVIDACQGLGAPGAILKLVWPAPEIAKIRQPFGHNLTLQDVLALATSVEQLPCHCEVWCIEGRAFEFGQPLSREVEAAAAQMISEFTSRLNQPQRSCMNTR